MRVRYYAHARRDRSTVALTFDDGPNPPRTDQVLDILAFKDVRAAFFIIGKWAERFPNAVERIEEAGHVIGNHSYRHVKDLGDFDRAEAVITAITGKASAFLRFHYLDNFAVVLQSPLAISPEVKIVYADVNPADYAQTDPEEILRRVLDSPHLGNGSIIDLHDGSETEDDAARLRRPIPTIKALPKIIDGLRTRGLEPVGLDAMEFDQPYEWQPNDQGR
ncbi:MAG TPA: polysaccharide deacetylase family protein [bacterium]|nr:polysaccharide deacetylase family protein [bacterium]